MGQYNHFQYGESLASQLRSIAHTDEQQRFFPATEEEQFLSIEDRLSNIKGTILIAIDGSNSDFSWQPDNMTEKLQYFFIVFKNTNSERTETIMDAQKECRLIAHQIIARMMNEQFSSSYSLTTLDPDSFTIRGVGPLADNFYGVLIGFNLLNSFNYTIKPEYWL